MCEIHEQAYYNTIIKFINMTPLFVFCYMIYTTFISTILSLLLCFRLLLRRISSSSAATKGAGNVIALYKGTVYHERRHPAHNAFRFAIRYALIDLDRPPYAPPGFLSAEVARRAANTNGPVFLLTTPPSVGYRCSPVNIYYCYDIQGSNTIFKKCIIEGSNTPWGESVTFVFNPSFDSVPKCEYISPFSDMLGNWKLKASEPGDNLYAFMSVEHPKFGRNYLTATMKAKKISITSSTMQEDLDAFFWLQPHMISIITYWTGVKLWWKNVSFNKHPRKRNPTYREEAVARSGKTIQFCPAFGGNNIENDVIETINRCFEWKDAPWPWSYLIAPVKKEVD